MPSFRFAGITGCISPAATNHYRKTLRAAVVSRAPTFSPHLTTFLPTRWAVLILPRRRQIFRAAWVRVPHTPPPPHTPHYRAICTPRPTTPRRHRTPPPLIYHLSLMSTCSARLHRCARRGAGRGWHSAWKNCRSQPYPRRICSRFTASVSLNLRLLPPKCRFLLRTTARAPEKRLYLRRHKD